MLGRRRFKPKVDRQAPSLPESVSVSNAGPSVSVSSGSDSISEKKAGVPDDISPSVVVQEHIPATRDMPTVSTDVAYTDENLNCALSLVDRDVNPGGVLHVNEPLSCDQDRLNVAVPITTEQALLDMSVSSSEHHDAEVIGESAVPCTKAPTVAGLLTSPIRPRKKFKLRPSHVRFAADTAESAGAFNDASEESTAVVDKKHKRRVDSMEVVQRSVMTMADLVRWNPVMSQPMTRKPRLPKAPTYCPSLKRSAVPAHHRELQLKQEHPAKVEDDSFSAASYAPQLVVGPDGALVIDESSLVVNPEKRHIDARSVKDIVVESGRRVTTSSFRRRQTFNGQRMWSVRETQKFYQVLSATGPDFTIMQSFFPGRSRQELKMKFKREDSKNEDKLTESLRRRVTLDEDFYQQIEVFDRDTAAATAAEDKQKEEQLHKNLETRRIKAIERAKTLELRQRAKALRLQRREANKLHRKRPGKTVQMQGAKKLRKHSRNTRSQHSTSATSSPGSSYHDDPTHVLTDSECTTEEAASIIRYCVLQDKKMERKKKTNVAPDLEQYDGLTHEALMVLNQCIREEEMQTMEPMELEAASILNNCIQNDRSSESHSYECMSSCDVSTVLSSNSLACSSTGSLGSDPQQSLSTYLGGQLKGATMLQLPKNTVNVQLLSSLPPGVDFGLQRPLDASRKEQLLLVHERSTATGQPDMVHLYMLTGEQAEMDSQSQDKSVSQVSALHPHIGRQSSETITEMESMTVENSM